MTIRWVFKNGYTFDTVCEDFKSSKSKLLTTGMIGSFTAKGITKNKPLGMDLTELIAVIRLVEDEINPESEGGEE